MPVVGESTGGADAYGDDRCFVFVTLAAERDPALGSLADALRERGHPVTELELGDPLDLGGEFLRWEIATAAAGIVLGIDPFDQPNVQESKDATKALLAAFAERGRFPPRRRSWRSRGWRVYADPDAIGDTPVSVDGALSQLLSLVSPGDYLALLAYLPRDPDLVSRLEGWRTELRNALGVATTLGFGPRFLHSTGQLHKGGPPSRGLPADHRRAGTGSADPGLEGDLRHAGGGAGAGRPRVAPEAAATCHPGASHRPRSRARPPGGGAPPGASRGMTTAIGAGGQGPIS